MSMSASRKRTISNISISEQKKSDNTKNNKKNTPEPNVLIESTFVQEEGDDCNTKKHNLRKRKALIKKGNTVNHIMAKYNEFVNENSNEHNKKKKKDEYDIMTSKIIASRIENLSESSHSKSREITKNKKDEELDDCYDKNENNDDDNDNDDDDDDEFIDEKIVENMNCKNNNKTIGIDENVTKNVKSDTHGRLQLYKKKYNESKINSYKIAEANFCEKDAMWLYKNIQRLEDMDGRDKFDLEDKIERRFKFLKFLQENKSDVNFNKLGDSDRDVTKEIIVSSHTDHTKQMLLNKMYSVTNDSVEEYQKMLYWLDTILKIPTCVKSINVKSMNDQSKNEKIQLSLITLYNNLNNNLYGMDYVIQQILQAVCTILIDPDNKGYILAMIGPPGVGKTTISSLIASSIGMGFGQISCGSINDQAIITGHSSTYVGSKPGFFTQQLIKSEQLDNVILLDEMDELHDKKLVPILLQILDKTQNDRFKDAFCPEIDIDLSKNLFVVTANSVDFFDTALKDRLKIINVSGYTIEQKYYICIKHVIPKIMKKTGICIVMDHGAILKYINIISPKNSGVREIEKFFSDIYEKLLLIKIMNVNTFFDEPFEKIKLIDDNMIIKLIGSEIKL